MKIYLFALCLLFALSAAAQMQPVMPTRAEAAAKEIAMGKEMAAPFKGANLLVVYPPDSARVALRKTALLLQGQGFAIDRLDYDLLSLSTKPKQFTQGGFHTMSMFIVWSQGALNMSGQWRAQAFSMTIEEQAAYTNPASKRALLEIERVAKAYPLAKVFYKLRP